MPLRRPRADLLAQLLHADRPEPGRRRAQRHGQPPAAVDRQFRQPAAEADATAATTTPGRRTTSGACVRLWIDTGAAYPGTYAALGTGMIGGFEIVDRSIRLDRSDLEWPSVQGGRWRRSSGAARAATTRRSRCRFRLRTRSAGRLGHGLQRRAALGRPDAQRRAPPLVAPPALQPDAAGEVAAAAGPAGQDGRRPRVVRQGRLRRHAATPTTATSSRPSRTPSGSSTRSSGSTCPAFGRARSTSRDAAVRHPSAELAGDAPIDVYATDRAYWQSLWHRADAAP